MKRTIMTVMASLVAMIVNASLDTTPSFEVAKNVAQRVSFPPATQTVIMYLDLPNGEWSVNAELNLFAYGSENMKVYYASFLGFTPTIDWQNGRTALGSMTIQQSRIDAIVPLVGRRIQVTTPPNTTKRVYLTVYAWNTDNGTIINAAAYGFAYAVRVAP